jgi:hypothetical protein
MGKLRSRYLAVTLTVVFTLDGPGGPYAVRKMTGLLPADGLARPGIALGRVDGPCPFGGAP